MNAIVKDRSAIPTLKDPKLFRDRAYVDGTWVEADSRKRFDVDNPAGQSATDPHDGERLARGRFISD